MGYGDDGARGFGWATRCDTDGVYRWAGAAGYALWRFLDGDVLPWLERLRASAKSGAANPQRGKL